MFGTCPLGALRWCRKRIPGISIHSVAILDHPAPAGPLNVCRHEQPQERPQKMALLSPTQIANPQNWEWKWMFWVVFYKEIGIRADQPKPLPSSPLSAPPLFVMIYMLLFCAPRMLCAHHSLYCICLLVHFSPLSEHLKGKDCLPFSLIFPGSRAESWCSIGQMEKGVMRHSHLFTLQKTCSGWHSLDPEAFPMCQLAMQLRDGPPS